MSYEEFLIDLQYELMRIVNFKATVDYATFWTSTIRIPKYIGAAIRVLSMLVVMPRMPTS